MLTGKLILVIKYTVLNSQTQRAQTMRRAQGKLVDSFSDGEIKSIMEVDGGTK